jgi:hypothetical protein
MTVPLSHLTLGTLVEDTNWNDKVDAINLAFTEIGATTGIVQRPQSMRGLYLRTHPDATVAANQILLAKADELVMDDGARLTGWSNIAADITNSGATGLDVGSRAVSTWYEIYAIAKEDGTKSVLLHRSKGYFIDQAQFTNNQDAGINNVAGAQKRAQGFLANAFPINHVDLILRRNNAPTGRIWLTIVSDSAGAPVVSNILATSDKLDASTISTSNQFVRFIFRQPFTPATNTTPYWLVVNVDYGTNATDHIVWRVANTAPYANGTEATYNGSTWLNEALDGAFALYTVTADAAVTMPTGYTKKTQIGYVYNDASNKLRGMFAQDRVVRETVFADVGTFTTTLPTLTDISSFVPPLPVLIEFMGYSSVAGDVIRLSPVPGGYSPTTPDYVNASVNVANIDIPMGWLLTETQAIYAQRNSGTGNAVPRIRCWRW